MVKMLENFALSSFHVLLVQIFVQKSI